MIRTCPPARVRDELLKDFHSGQALPFFKLMLDSQLFYAIFPAWAGRLGESGESRLLDLIGRLDLMVQNGYPVSDSLLWAVFLTAFLEPELKPREFKELREFIQERIKAALGGIEFPRARQDEVSQMLALEAAGGASPGQRPAHPGPADPADPLSRHLAAPSNQDRAGGGTAGSAVTPRPCPRAPPPAKRRRQRRRRPRGGRDGKGRLGERAKKPGGGG